MVSPISYVREKINMSIQILLKKDSSFEFNLFLRNLNINFFNQEMKKEISMVANARPHERDQLTEKMEKIVVKYYPSLRLAPPTPLFPTAPAAPPISAAAAATSPAAPPSIPAKKATLLSLLEPLFRLSRAVLSPAEFSYQANTNDFGVQIQELVFTIPNNEIEAAEAKRKIKADTDSEGIKIDHFAKNMQEVALQCGFTLTFSKYSYPIRDHWLRRAGGTILTFCNTDEAQQSFIKKALLQNQLRAQVHKSSAGFMTKHSFFSGGIGAAHHDHFKAVPDLSALLAMKDVSGLLFYFEGGNHWLVTHPSKKALRTLLIGEDNFHVALNQLLLNGTFNNPHLFVEATAKRVRETLTPEMISSILLEIDSQPVIANLFKGLDPSAKCAKYLAHKQILIEIVAMSFEVSAENIILIPQLGYHLDVFMRPGPKGSLFVQDFSLCEKMLEQIKAHAEALNLSAADQTILERYLATAHGLNHELAPLQVKIKRTLAKAGFVVIPTPGIFYDQSLAGSKTYNVNFINSITGWSDSIKKYYYITAGAQVGDRLGGVLMDAFSQFIHQYQDGIDIHYIGGDRSIPQDFKEAMNWWNRVESQAGPHCFSFEKATKTHSSMS